MPTAPNGTPDPARLSGDLYRQWEKAMTGWWDQVLESPSFLGAVGQNLTANAQARSSYDKAVEETMERMNLPTRNDLVRVSKVCSLLEERLLAQEDTLLQLQDKLAASELEAVQARIEAAEARLELRDRLNAIEAMLSAALQRPAADSVATAPAGEPEAAPTVAPVGTDPTPTARPASSTPRRKGQHA